MGVSASLIGRSPLAKAWWGQGSAGDPKKMVFIVVMILTVVAAGHKVRVHSPFFLALADDSCGSRSVMMLDGILKVTRV